MRPKKEVADVLRKLGKNVEQIGLNNWQLRTLRAVKQCRTAALGGHVDACNECGNITISYNSCRNRHCPKCQGKNREDWIKARENELLPVPYFHVVFTLPDDLNSLAMHEPKLVYDTLFEAAWETLYTFGKNKDVHMGMIAILHTWGQNLSLHPHLHCIVPGGGIDKDGNWTSIRSDGNFLFPVKALSKVFRAKYCQKINKKSSVHYTSLRQNLWNKNWIVFAKRPFGNPKSVVEYLGRYSHKIAISNHRIASIDNQSVTFSYKEYRQNGVKKQLTLTHQEFIRRFAMHILPKRFVKIRHFGFLSSNWKRKKLKIVQAKMNAHVTDSKEKTTPTKKCNCCKKGTLITIEVFSKRGPPQLVLAGSRNMMPSKY